MARISGNTTTLLASNTSSASGWVRDFWSTVRRYVVSPESLLWGDRPLPQALALEVPVANDPAAKAAIRVIAIAEDVAVAAADAVLHVVDAVQAGEAGITIVRHAKIIHLKGIARNHASGKRIIVNVKMARVMKMRMFPI